MDTESQAKPTDTKAPEKPKDTAVPFSPIHAALNMIALEFQTIQHAQATRMDAALDTIRMALQPKDPDKPQTANEK